MRQKKEVVIRESCPHCGKVNEPPPMGEQMSCNLWCEIIESVKVARVICAFCRKSAKWVSRLLNGELVITLHEVDYGAVVEPDGKRRVLYLTPTLVVVTTA